MRAILVTAMLICALPLAGCGGSSDVPPPSPADAANTQPLPPPPATPANSNSSSSFKVN